MRLAFPCRNCGKPVRPVSVDGHPYRHVETGKAACAPVTKAEPEEGTDGR